LIAANPNCQKLRGNIDAEAIFNILSKDENIIAMLEISDLGKPALSACIKEIEKYFDLQKAPTFDLNEGFSKQAVGRMVKTIIKPFGYETHIQRELPKSCASKYFTSATCYRKTGIATMKVVKTIVEISESEGGE
jgi:hypothetical protein